MNSNDIETSIRNGIRETTPDLLDGLMDELGLQPEASPTMDGANVGLPANVVPLPSARRPRNWLRAIIPAAAILILVAVGFFAAGNMNRETFAVVGLDVNPSIELSVDDRERVISANALNDDAATVLDGLQLQGTDLNTACHAVVGSMLVNGYLRPDSNSILVSIQASDEQAGKALEQRISKNLNSYLENSEVAVAILGQYVNDDEQLARFADAQGISLGKAWLIQKLLAMPNTKMNEASLLKLTTQDLILLAQERKVEADTSIGTSDTSAYISKDKAADIALADATVSRDNAAGLQVEFDCEDGALIYEVEFSAGGTNYEYDIDARTGKVVSNETEAADPGDGDGENAGAYTEDDDDLDDDSDERDSDDGDDDADDTFDDNLDDDAYDADDDDDDDFGQYAASDERDDDDDDRGGDRDDDEDDD